MITKEDARNSQPVFIVGSPRSGTTFLSAMLSNHSRLCCGPETQFFNKLDTEKLINDALDRSLLALDYVERAHDVGAGLHEMSSFGWRRVGKARPPLRR